MSIYSFKQFESYLKSGRHLLYHTMSYSGYAKMILDNDEIRIGIVARGPSGICLSRSINWTNQYSNDYRFVLDSDILKRDGYKSIPLQELMYQSRSHKTHKVNRNVWKGNLEFYKSSKRSQPHNTSLPDHSKSLMETEFEERILKNIKNAGKYIVYIDFVSYPKDEFLKSLAKYIDRYPHIKTRIMDRKNSHKVKEFSPKDLLQQKSEILVK